MSITRSNKRSLERKSLKDIKIAEAMKKQQDDYDKIHKPINDYIDSLKGKGTDPMDMIYGSMKRSSGAILKKG